MTLPNICSEISDNTTSRGNQLVANENPAGKRIIAALGDRSRAWLLQTSGLPDSTISDAIKRGPARTEVALKLAAALNVSLDWLVLGLGSTIPATLPAPALLDASDADWISISTFDLGQLDDEGKGNPTGATPVRRDWLNRALGTTSGLWLAEAPCDYSPAGLAEGDKVLCRDVSPAELHDRNLCIWRDLETFRLFVGRFSAIRHDSELVGEEYWVGAYAVMARRDGQPDVVPVARIVGQPIARVR